MPVLPLEEDLWFLLSWFRDDLGESKGKTNMTSLGRSRWGRDSTIEFLARVIGMVKVSLPNFTSNAPDEGGSTISFSKECPIMM
jgi:hypothetical protein